MSRRVRSLAAAVALSAAAAAIVWRRRSAPADTAAQTPPARRPWSCACGAAYELAGADRHRVYWRAGAPQDDPVLEQDCTQCGRPLPAGHEAPLAR